MSQSFDAVWEKIVREVRPTQEIRNWGQARGYTGGTFCIEQIDRSGILVSGGNMSVARPVSRGDFEKVYNVWEAYTGGEYTRAEMTQISQNTTYILSILHLTLRDGR